MSTSRPARLARIDPQRCIGCTRCIDACPFDAIIGAPQRMHTVIGDWCIGCDLCIPPCPVDCIEMSPVQPPASLSREAAIEARERRERRKVRLAREALVPPASPLDRHAIVAEALRRAQQRDRDRQRSGTTSGNA